MGAGQTVPAVGLRRKAREGVAAPKRHVHLNGVLRLGGGNQTQNLPMTSGEGREVGQPWGWERRSQKTPGRESFRWSASELTPVCDGETVGVGPSLTNPPPGKP